jgi:cytochrome c-type biogenesis protein CcmH
MTLWLAMTLMTAAAIFAVLWPLGRRSPLRSGSDVAVYRDQLDEIARDEATGLIPERDAEAARIEVSRRLIAAADAAPTVVVEGSARRRRVAAVAALVLLPLGAASLYLKLGAPQVPDAPHAARQDTRPDQRPVAELVGRVEAHLEQNPDDGRGWEVLAPVYMRLGRFDDAIRARRNALRLLGDSADRSADLGEALTAAASGVVTADAKAAFERALAQDGKSFKARFFLGLAAEQDGRRDEAAATWRALLAESPADAPWRALVEESLQRVDPKTTKPAPAVQAPAAPAPSPEDIAAADKMAPQQRDQMIRGMVARLAERLAREGGDVDGWLRLMRAYMVLGDRDKARAAAGDARKALTGDPDKLRRLDEFIKELGLEG